MGGRFRMIVNEVDIVQPDRPLHKLPVALAVWRPGLYAGGAYHTGFSQALTSERLQEFTDIAKVEFIRIDADRRLRRFRNELRWSGASRVY
jgi:L-arabinose isomerase